MTEQKTFDLEFRSGKLYQKVLVFQEPTSDQTAVDMPPPEERWVEVSGQ